MDLNYAARLRGLSAPPPPPLSPQAARFVDLPNELAGAENTIAPLVTRQELLANFFTVHMNQNYALSGTPPDSFEMIGGSDSFAQHGILFGDYSANTDTIDLRGLTVQLDGVDITIENMSNFAGLAGEFLVFIGDEIMSIVGSTVLDEGQYRLQVARNRFGSARQDHTAGDDIFIIKQSLMPKLTHPQFQKGNTVDLKISMQANGTASDLADVTATSFEVEGNFYNLPAPSALSINGISNNPGIDTGVPIPISWVNPVITGLDMSRAYILLEFLVADVVTQSLQVDWPGESTSYPYTGSAPANFVLRASVVVDDEWQTITGQSIEIAGYRHSVT